MQQFKLIYSRSQYWHHLYHSNIHLKCGHSQIELIPIFETSQNSDTTIKEYRCSCYSETTSHTVALEPIDNGKQYSSLSNKTITFVPSTRILTIN